MYFNHLRALMLYQYSTDCLVEKQQFYWGEWQSYKNRYMVSLDENRTDMGGGLK